MPDRFAIRCVVLSLGLVLVGSVAAITFLAFTQTPIPDALSQLSFGALTGVTGLLASTRSGPAQMEVVNTATDPVPVAEQTPPVDDL